MEKINELNSQKKVLLLGAAGMAGHVLFKTLSAWKEYDILDVTRNVKVSNATRILDITDKSKVVDLVGQYRPDYIVNCIGVLVKGSNVDPENAIYVNAYFPHLLAKAAKSANARLIHISTDCVFSGEKGGYMENDFTDGRDTYAKSKALGEVINDRDLTIRTSIIGPELKKEGEGLFHWFMNQQGQINGYTSAFWSGVTTVELAKAILAFMQTNTTGLIHLTNGIPVSKYDLLHLFKKHFKHPVDIQPYEGKKVNKSLLNTRNDIQYVVPSYDSMIEEMKVFMDKNKNYYNYTF